MKDKTSRANDTHNIKKLLIAMSVQKFFMMIAQIQTLTLNLVITEKFLQDGILI